MVSKKVCYLFTSFILLMLGGSILLNVLLFNQAKKYYLQVNETRLDPFGLNHYPVNLKKQNDKGKIRVVFFGDSRAEGWIWPNIGGYEFINRGIHTQTSAQTVQRFAFHVRSLQKKEGVRRKKEEG